MKKTRKFRYVKFSPDVIQEAWDCLENYIDKEKKKKIDLDLVVNFENEEWKHDNESEFIADYIKDPKYACFTKSANYGEYKIHLFFYEPSTDVSVYAPDRAIIEKVQQIFEKNLEKCTLPKNIAPAAHDPILFIGHGQSQQ